MPAISASKVDILSSCLYKYWLRYIARKKSIGLPVRYLDMGRLVHEALDILADYPVEENIDACVREATNRLSTLTIDKDLMDEAKKLIKGWFSADKFKGQTLVKEEKMSLCLQCAKFVPWQQNICEHCGADFYHDPNTIRYDGIIDIAYDLGNGVYKVKDYKTGWTIWTRAMVEKSPQLYGYVLLMTGLVAERKLPKIEQMLISIDQVFHGNEVVVDADPADAGAYVKHLREIAPSMHMTEEPKGTVGPQCAWCDYARSCSYLHDWLEDMGIPDLSKASAQGVIATYADFNAKKKAIEKIEKEMKEWLVAYMQANGTSVLTGDNGISVRMVSPSHTRYDPGTAVKALPPEVLADVITIRNKALEDAKERMGPEEWMAMQVTMTREPRSSYLKIRREK